MSKLIKVYFNNGNTAIYNADRVSFRCDPPTRETIRDLGSIRAPQYKTSIINWNAVSWMREYDEREDMD